MGNKLDCEGARARERKVRDEYMQALESAVEYFSDENEQLRMRVVELEDEIDEILDRLQQSVSVSDFEDEHAPAQSGIHRRVQLGADSGRARRG